MRGESGSPGRPVSVVVVLVVMVVDGEIDYSHIDICRVTRESMESLEYMVGMVNR